MSNSTFWFLLLHRLLISASGISLPLLFLINSCRTGTSQGARAGIQPYTPRYEVTVSTTKSNNCCCCWPSWLEHRNRRDCDKCQCVTWDAWYLGTLPTSPVRGSNGGRLPGVVWWGHLLIQEHRLDRRTVHLPCSSWNGLVHRSYSHLKYSRKTAALCSRFL